MKHDKIISVVRERQRKAYARRMEEIAREREVERITQNLERLSRAMLQKLEEKSRRRWWHL